MTAPTREQFCQQFKYWSGRLPYSDVQIARILQISRPTVARWRNGEAAPHPVGRDAILTVLRRHAGF